MGLAVADVFLEPAGDLVRVGQRHVGGQSDGDEYDEPAGGVQQPQLARRLSGAVDDKLPYALALQSLEPARSSPGYAATGCSKGSRWVCTSSTPGCRRSADATRCATAWASATARRARASDVARRSRGRRARRWRCRAPPGRVARRARRPARGRADQGPRAAARDVPRRRCPPARRAPRPRRHRRGPGPPRPAPPPPPPPPPRKKGPPAPPPPPPPPPRSRP